MNEREFISSLRETNSFIQKHRDEILPITDHRDLLLADTFLSNDEVQEILEEYETKIFQAQLPEFPEEKIFVTGSPILDNLEVERSAEYKNSGRQKLSLSENVFVVLYLDMGSIPQIDIDDGTVAPDLNEKTFQNTLQAISEFAQTHRDKEIAFVVRPHPTTLNPEQLSPLANLELPQNLKIIPAPSSTLSMQEATYAADVITSINSTENFLAPARLRQSIFLGYKGLGDNLLEKIYGRELIHTIDQHAGTKVISSPQEFISALETYSAQSREVVSAPSTTHLNATEKILDKIFD